MLLMPFSYITKSHYYFYCPTDLVSQRDAKVNNEKTSKSHVCILRTLHHIPYMKYAVCSLQSFYQILGSFTAGSSLLRPFYTKTQFYIKIEILGRDTSRLLSVNNVRQRECRPSRNPLLFTGSSAIKSREQCNKMTFYKTMTFHLTCLR
jgi:hypothetical protein